MPEIDPTIFALTAGLLVALLVVVPRLRQRHAEPTTHERYFGPTPKHHAKHPGGVARPAGPPPAADGAPRAPSPNRVTRSGQVTEGGASDMTPLRLPVE